METVETVDNNKLSIRCTEENQAQYRRLRLYTWIAAVCMAAVVITLVFTAWLFGVRVLDGGMAPAIAPGDVILFDRLAKHFHAPERGSVVAFSDTAGEGAYIGRVVGLPGETVTVADGRIYINGYLLDERAYAMGACADMESVAVPAGSYFILPDDRTHTVVSGGKLIVDAARIKGCAWLRVAPISRMGIF